MLFSWASFQALLSIPGFAQRLLAPSQTQLSQFTFDIAEDEGANSRPIIDCLTGHRNDNPIKNLVDLITCFDEYTVPANFYTPSTYNKSQPTFEERDDFYDIVSSMMHVDGNCLDLIKPQLDISPLGSYYGVTEVKFKYDKYTHQSYCILFEKETFNSTAHFYAKGWGLFVVPAKKEDIKRNIHFSAPHPAFDLGTPMQAAALFNGTQGRSLFIPGRSRLAYMVETDCVQPFGNEKYWVTDPAHDTREPFFIANKAIWEYQKFEDGGCPSDTCAFIQMHGKGASTCPDDTVFISSGLGGTRTSIEWYRKHTQLPAGRLQRNIKKRFINWNPTLPSDSSCSLTATTNVVGRLINNIRSDDVCDTASDPTRATGEFVHIEQSIGARGEGNYGRWIQVMEDTFKSV